VSPDETTPDSTPDSKPSPTGGASADDKPGPELARAVLDAAKVRRAAAPQRRSGDGAATGRRRRRGYTGPGPDARDPQPFGALLTQLIKARVWRKPAAEARIFGFWEAVVGAEIAAHCRPVKLEDGELTIEAESTAWATQLRLLAGKLLGRIGADVGRDVVARLNIRGPVAPSWAKGPKRVRGRGPRDTYG
jgi:predicted nucleic acid-binding Zn ribbon protein